MALREKLLPADERIVPLAQSALDRSWMDRVDDSHGVFITAEGLLMYLEPDDALGLIRDCAARFPGGQMILDSIPPWFSRRTLKGKLKLSDRYIAPPMPFSLTPDEAVGLAGRIPGVRIARDVRMPPGRGLFKLMASPAWDRLGFPRTGRPSFTLLEFGCMTRYAAFLRGDQRRRRQPQDGRGGQSFRRRRIHRRANDFGQRQRPAGQPRRGGRGQEEGREGVARRRSATTPGCWPTTSTPCGPSPKGSRSSARSTDTTPTSRSSPTADVLDELAALAKDAPARREDRSAARASSTGRCRRGHAGHHHRQDHGQEALQIVDDHPQPAHGRQGLRRYIRREFRHRPRRPTAPC